MKAGLWRRHHKTVEPVQPVEAVEPVEPVQPVQPVGAVDLVDRMLEDWMMILPFRRSPLPAPWVADDLIKVDEYRDDDTMVVRAELPGIDPGRDVELAVMNQMLHIAAERRKEEQTEEKGYVRRELRYGSFSRSLPLPAGTTEADVTASYKDGILEIRVPAPRPDPSRKIPVARH